MKRNILKNGLLTCAAIAAAFVGGVPAANAGLTVAPTIAVIAGRDRYADLSLINPDKEAAFYEVGWTFMKMEEGTGKYIDTDKSTTDFDLTKHIVVTPRRVTLPGKGVQKVRFGLRLNGEPPAPGDYRAHVTLASKPAESAPQQVDKQSDPSQPKKARVGVTINVGFSIPVVYRVGESTDTVEMGAVKTQINQTTKKIEVVIPVTKTKSAFGAMGAMNVYYKDELVGEVKNANIFPEITSRTFVVPLKVEKLAGGSLKIVYRDFDKKKDKILAEKTIPVAN